MRLKISQIAVTKTCVRTSKAVGPSFLGGPSTKSTGRAFFYLDSEFLKLLPPLPYTVDIFRSRGGFTPVNLSTPLNRQSLNLFTLLVSKLTVFSAVSIVDHKT